VSGALSCFFVPVVCMQAWVSARKASDFSRFKDYLQQWVDVSLQKAAAIDPSRPAYDVSTRLEGADPVRPAASSTD
jgi:Zn-dependent M32 family carboxypeptidase